MFVHLHTIYLVYTHHCTYLLILFIIRTCMYKYFPSFLLSSLFKNFYLLYSLSSSTSKPFFFSITISLSFLLSLPSTNYNNLVTLELESLQKVGKPLNTNSTFRRPHQRVRTCDDSAGGSLGGFWPVLRYRPRI